MRTYLAAVVALSLSWNVAPAGWAGEHYATPLPGPLGRFFGVGYGAGYHAHQPDRPGRDQRAAPFAAPWRSPGLACGPAAIRCEPANSGAVGNEHAPCAECSGAASQIPAHAGVRYDGLLEQPALELDSTPAAAAQSQAIQQPLQQPIQQPPREHSSRNNSGFLKRLPNIRGAASVSDLPAPPSPPKKASVARSSVPEIESR